MYLKNLSLVNFKNYREVELEFSEKINCFVGDNGVGKTNLLDAIHYLCLCKSYFNIVDSDAVRYESEFSIIQGSFVSGEKADEVYCGIQPGKRKIFKRNKKEYTKLSDHIGLFPLVVISPLDYELILDGGEERRKFMNTVISQYNHEYLELIIRYNKVVAQRNKLLKDDLSRYDNETMDVYNHQMIEYGEKIFKFRKDFAEKLVPVFQKYYEFVSDNREVVELIYQSQLLEGDYKQLLLKSEAKERILQYSIVGPHKDDLILNLFGHNIKKGGSQGQQKTYLIALKLAQFDFIYSISNKLPLLLLDDVFDKFDETRVRQIIKLVSKNKFGQIFITHTNIERMNKVINDIEVDSRIFYLEKEKINIV